MVLGYDNVDDYAADPRFLGALVGRYANRIARGRFALDGTEYRLEANDGENHLHGGAHGFHQAVWGARPFADASGVGAADRRHHRIVEIAVGDAADVVLAEDAWIHGITGSLRDRSRRARSGTAADRACRRSCRRA
ncbi:MAG: hypothetical protein ABR611_16420 [Chthoniobacterales bacterium]